MLKDTVIRGKGEGPREMGGAGEGGQGRVKTLSSGKQEVEKHSPKTAALMALSRPRKPISRSQSHITESGEVCRLFGVVKCGELWMQGSSLCTLLIADKFFPAYLGHILGVYN